MTEKRQILEINEKKKYLMQYLELLVLERGLKEGMTYFKQKIGCNTQASSVSFKNEFDEYDLTFSENINLGERQIILEFGMPYPEEIYMYIDFNVFCALLEKWIKEKYSDNTELLGILEEVKVALGC